MNHIWVAFESTSTKHICQVSYGCTNNVLNSWPLDQTIYHCTNFHTPVHKSSYCNFESISHTYLLVFFTKWYREWSPG